MGNPKNEKISKKKQKKQINLAPFFACQSNMSKIYVVYRLYVD